MPGEKLLVPIFVGDGEFLAAVAAAGGKDPAAVGGRHSLTETVFVHAFAVGGLECSFHCNVYLFF